MTAQGRYAAPDSQFGRSAGNAAARGGALIAVAVVIGFLLLWQGGVGGSGTEVSGAASSENDSSEDDQTQTGTEGEVTGETGTEGEVTGETGTEGEVTGETGTEGEVTGETGTTEETTDTTPATPVTRPPGDVKVAVANGVGEAGLAGAREAVLSTVGYVTAAVNAASPTAQSQVYYLDGYGEEAQAVAVELGGDAAVLRPAPSDPGALVADATAVADFHIFVILGSDRVLG